MIQLGSRVTVQLRPTHIQNLNVTPISFAPRLSLHIGLIAAHGPHPRVFTNHTKSADRDHITLRSDHDQFMNWVSPKLAPMSPLGLHPSVTSGQTGFPLAIN